MDIVGSVRFIKDKLRPNRYRLDEFLISGGEKRPFALIFPGGGYAEVCSFAEGTPYAKALNKNGYSAFVLYYSVRGKAKFPAPVEDAARALRYIIDNADRLNVDVNNYTVWGSSAGGHLAGFFSSASGCEKYGLPKPKATVLCYPVVTMGEYAHKGSRKYLIGENASDELVKMTSVERLVDKNYPPTFVWYSAADKTVDPENSKMLIKALADNGVSHKSMEFGTVSHGMGLGVGTECEPWFGEALDFWRKSC